MMRTIETRSAAAYAEHVAEFRVYASPQDASRVLGYVLPYIGDASGEEARSRTIFEFGEPVAEAFLIALALCEKHGVEILWVHDPDNLFPPEKRPVRGVGAR